MSACPHPFGFLRACLVLAFALTANFLHAVEAATVVLSNLERIYSASPATLSADDITVTPSAEVAGAYTLKITYAGKTTAPINAGSYPVVVTATSLTHSGTATGTLVITPAPLSATVADASRLVGAANPKFTVLYEGFVGADTDKVLDRKPSATTTAKPASPAGDYPIVVAGGRDNNYTFTAQSPGTLTVIPTFGGTYETLLFDLAAFDVALGKLTVTLPAKGNKFTARVEYTHETQPLAFSGQLVATNDLSGVTGTALRTRSGSSAYELKVTATPEGVSATLRYRPDVLSGFGGFITVPPLVQTQIYTKVTPAPWAGAYTLVLPDTTPLFDFNYPVGIPFASVTIDPAGKLTLSGKLSDGAPITASAAPDATGRYRFFFRPYGTRLNSYLSGQLPLVPHPDTRRAGLYYVPTSLDNIFYWQKTANAKDALYPDGFSQLYTLAALDPWQPPAPAVKKTATPAVTLAQRLGLAANEFVSGYANIEYGFADYGQSELKLPLNLEATPKNTLVPLLPDAPANPLGWKISVTTKTGRFTASFKLTDTLETGPVTRTVKVEGTLRQPPAGDTDIAHGYLLLQSLPDAFDLATLSHAFTLSSALDE